MKGFLQTSFGSLPLKPGIDMITFSLVYEDIAEPNLIFNISACFSKICRPCLISFVITLPPNGITDVCLIIPSKKIATSVVPPPISTRHTPSCNSSLSKTATMANGQGLNF